MDWTREVFVLLILRVYQIIHSSSVQFDIPVQCGMSGEVFMDNLNVAAVLDYLAT